MSVDHAVRTTPTLRDPAPTIPNAMHRAAADRAVRIAHELGAIEVAAFYEDLSPAARPLVFALVARAALKPRSSHGDDEPTRWWTAAELRHAHNLWVQGSRERWVCIGHKLYGAEHKRARRALAAMRHEGTS